MWHFNQYKQCYWLINTKGDDYIKRILLFLLLTFTITGTTYATDTIHVEGYTSGVNEGYYTEQTFISYCPLCGHYDCLETYVKGVNELTCTVCDADYSYSGKDKTYNPRAWLKPYFPPKLSLMSKNKTS